MNPATNRMADLVETLIADDRWQNENIGAVAEKTCRGVLAELSLAPENFEISLLASSNQQIATLNSNFRGRSTATNVLSWPAFDLAAQHEGDAPFLPEFNGFEPATGLGDIAVAFETCKSEAKSLKRSLNDHLIHLLAHGCLHLLGYDHVLEKDAALMEALEVKILAKLGVADPY